MTDYRKMFSILWKRNRIWIIMLMILSLLFISFIVKNEIASLDYSILTNVIKLDYMDKEGRLLVNDYSDEYKNAYIELERRMGEVKKTYPKGLPEDFLTKGDYTFHKLAEKYNYQPRYGYNEDLKEWHYTGVESMRHEELHSYEREVNSKIFRDEGHYKLNISSYLFGGNFPIYLAMLIISFLITSMEHLTSYYEFTETFPWSKTRTYFSKLLFILTLALILFALTVGLKYMVWSTSLYKNLMGLDKVLKIGLNSLMGFFGYILIFMGLGTVAGNILGHIGMLIIGILGVRLWLINIRALSDVIFGGDIIHHDHWIYRPEKAFDNLPQFIKVLLSPLESYNYSDRFFAYINNQAIFVVGLALMILGLFWANFNKSERSGMLIMRKNVSLYAQVLAVLTTTNAIYLISRGMTSGRILELAVFGIAFLLSYLFYKKLFKVRIGI